MTRVIHTGDTHVGYRQYHSPERRQDFLEAFGQVVADATEAEVDAVVHAGDLFNDRRPDLQDLLGTISILETLRDADIPFLAIVGNHEDARRGQWLDLFERLGLAVHLDESGTVIGNTAFYGLDYVPESKRDRLDYAFETTEAAHAALVGHGLFEPFPHGDWDLRAVLAAASIDFDAVLLGDDHTPDTKRVGDTWATYCGSTERTSASEREDRGYNLVEFDGDVSITRRGLETRDFVFVDVELGPSEGAEYIRERIRESDVDGSVVIVTVEGDGDALTPAEIEAFGQEQGALVTRVNDRREFEEESEIEVSFADPDDAVRERIRSMGLSEAARAVDEVIREDEIARSNVRPRVKEQVEELLDEDSAFQPAEPEDGSPEEGSSERARAPVEEPSETASTERVTPSLESMAEATASESAGVTADPGDSEPDREADTRPVEAGAERDGESDSDEDDRGSGSDENDRGSGSDEDAAGSSADEDDPGPASDTGPRETTMEDFL